MAETKESIVRQERHRITMDPALPWLPESLMVGAGHGGKKFAGLWPTKWRSSKALGHHQHIQRGAQWVGISV